MDEAGARCKLYAVARSVAQVVEEKFVHAKQRLAFVGYHAVVFVKLGGFFSAVVVAVVVGKVCRAFVGYG